jgi:hypothetical protein
MEQLQIHLQLPFWTEWGHISVQNKRSNKLWHGFKTS